MLILVDNGLGKLSQSSFPSMLRDTVTQSSGACYLEKHPVGCGLLKLSGGRLSLGAVGEPMAKNNGQDTPVAKKKILWKEKPTEMKLTPWSIRLPGFLPRFSRLQGRAGSASAEKISSPWGHKAQFYIDLLGDFYAMPENRQTSCPSGLNQSYLVLIRGNENSR